MVAELRAAAFPATYKPGAAGTARRNDGKPGRRAKSKSGELSDTTRALTWIYTTHREKQTKKSWYGCNSQWIYITYYTLLILNNDKRKDERKREGKRKNEKT